MNKYKSIKVWSELAQRTFDSKLECRRAEELILLEKAGEIEDLKFQVKFVLYEKPRITITIDFSYVEAGVFSEYKIPIKVLKYEDTKGVLTRDTRTKLAWLEEKHGVRVKLTRKDEVR